jgi:hydroxyisourate hydrolase
MSGRSGRPEGMLDRLNTASPDEVARILRECLAVDSWVAGVLAARPYQDEEALLGAASAIADGLTTEEVLGALHSHPRIGQRPTGAGTAAAWSRQEQAGVGSDVDIAARLRAGNAAYEDRFGHIYLVFASGKSGSDILADLESRMDNQPDEELAVARGHLRDIALVRLRRLLHETSAITTHVLDAATGLPAQGVPVVLEVSQGDGWTVLDQAATDADGRLRRLGPEQVDAGVYRLRFDTDSYYRDPAATFFPEITITFRITDSTRHHHVPILLSPFAYSTYRGS